MEIGLVSCDGEQNGLARSYGNWGQLKGYISRTFAGWEIMECMKRRRRERERERLVSSDIELRFRCRVCQTKVRTGKQEKRAPERPAIAQ